MLIDLTEDLLDSRHPRLLALARRLLDQGKGPLSAPDGGFGVISSVGVGGLDVAVGGVGQLLEVLLSYFGGSLVCLSGLDV